MMSKKSNTALFVLIATLVNMVLIIIFAIIGLWIFNRLFASSSEDAGAGMAIALFALCFLMPVVCSFLLYSFVIKKLNRKFRLEDKLAPLFGRKTGKGGAGRGAAGAGADDNLSGSVKG